MFIRSLGGACRRHILKEFDDLLIIFKTTSDTVKIVHDRLFYNFFEIYFLFLDFDENLL